MSIKKAAICLTIVAAALWAVPANAASIRILTGVDGANNVLADGATDPSWTISVDHGVTFPNAKVLYPIGECCGMETVGAQAKWISDPSTGPNSPNTGWGVGNTVYARRSFDLTGFNLATTDITGIWRVADFRMGIYLNGTLIDPATADNGSGWFSDQAFGGGAGLFVAGTNVLELRGDSGNSEWDGFWLDATVTDGAAAVPEPASLMLLGTGLVACVRRARRAK